MVIFNREDYTNFDNLRYGGNEKWRIKSAVSPEKVADLLVDNPRRNRSILLHFCTLILGRNKSASDEVATGCTEKNPKHYKLLEKQIKQANLNPRDIHNHNHQNPQT